MKSGKIYILSNPAIKDGLLKIGKTSKGTDKRNKQLSSSTSIPDKFNTEKDYVFNDIDNGEKLIHQELDEHRYKTNKEFFKCTVEQADGIIRRIQIEDFKNKLKSLSKNYSLKKRRTLEQQWKVFFIYMGWEVHNTSGTLLKREERNNVKSNFFMNTKELNGMDEVTVGYAKLFVINQSCSNINWNSSDLGKIRSEALDNYRTIVLLNDCSLFQLNKMTKGWDELRIIRSSSGYGLLDDDSFWSCFVNGVHLNQDEIVCHINRFWKEDFEDCD